MHLSAADERSKNFLTFSHFSLRQSSRNVSTFFPFFRAAERWKFLELFFQFLSVTEKMEISRPFSILPCGGEIENLDLFLFFHAMERRKFLDFFLHLPKYTCIIISLGENGNLSINFFSFPTIIRYL